MKGIDINNNISNITGQIVQSPKRNSNNKGSNTNLFKIDTQTHTDSPTKVRNSKQITTNIQLNNYNSENINIINPLTPSNNIQYNSNTNNQGSNIILSNTEIKNNSNLNPQPRNIDHQIQKSLQVLPTTTPRNNSKEAKISNPTRAKSEISPYNNLGAANNVGNILSSEMNNKRSTSSERCDYGDEEEFTSIDEKNNHINQMLKHIPRNESNDLFSSNPVKNCFIDTTSKISNRASEPTVHINISDPINKLNGSRINSVVDTIKLNEDLSHPSKHYLSNNLVSPSNNSIQNQNNNSESNLKPLNKKSESSLYIKANNTNVNHTSKLSAFNHSDKVETGI